MMKAELNINTDELVSRITQEVVKQLTPLFNGHDIGNELMDVTALASYLGVKKQWVYEKTHLNAIPYYKVGKYPRYRKSKIDEWLSKKENRNFTKRLL